MDGYWEGVQYYNQENGTNVEVLGWDQNKPAAGSFAGGFEDQAKGQQLAKNFIQQGADIIFPVAGPVGLGAAKEAQTTRQGRGHLGGQRWLRVGTAVTRTCSSPPC